MKPDKNIKIQKKIENSYVHNMKPDKNIFCLNSCDWDTKEKTSSEQLAENIYEKHRGGNHVTFSWILSEYIKYFILFYLIFPPLFLFNFFSSYIFAFRFIKKRK